MSGNVAENNTHAKTVAAGANLVRTFLKSHSFTPSPLPGIRLTRILVSHVEWLRKAQNRQVYTFLAGF